MSPANGPGHRSAGRAAAAEGKRSGGGRKTSRASKALGAAVKMTIESSYTDAREVQRLIRDEVERAGFDPDSQFAIKLALEEAIINAIKHGNKLDKNKHVQVEWKVTRDAAEIMIEDEGPGFSRSAVPDPTDEINLEKLTGRGILLIETYMSSVKWSKGGRRVHMVKKRDEGPSQAVKTA